jgi:hypothetical protein
MVPDCPEVGGARVRHGTSGTGRNGVIIQTKWPIVENVERRGFGIINNMQLLSSENQKSRDFSNCGLMVFSLIKIMHGSFN